MNAKLLEEIAKQFELDGVDLLRPGGRTEIVTPGERSSQDALTRVADESLDFVFIDGQAEFSLYRETICEWRKKLKPGGVLAGRDGDQPNVVFALQDVLPWTEVVVRGALWHWKKDVKNLGRWVIEPAAQGETGSSSFLFIPCACAVKLATAVASVCQAGTTIAVVDGSMSGAALRDFELPPGVGLFEPNMFRYFTQLQNWAQAEGRRRGVKWLIFMHADAECADPNVLPDLLGFAEELSQGTRVGVVFTAYDALCVFNIEAVNDVGAWDETFEWYWSDIDYYRRMRLRGWQLVNWPQASRVLHEPSATIRHDAEMAQRAESRNEYSRLHYAHKWGGLEGEEVHRIPYAGRP